MAIVIAQTGDFGVDGDQLRATFYEWNENQLGLCNVCYRVTGASGPPITFGDIAFALQTVSDGNWQALLPLTGFTLGTKVGPAKSKTGRLPGVATSTSIGSGSDGLPTQTRGIVSFTTAKAGRAFRGRIYVPFPKTSKIDTDGSPVASYVTDLDNLAAAIGVPGGIGVTGVLGGSCTIIPIIYHRALDTHDDITGATGKKLWATQRRSGNYGRQNPKAIPF